LLFLPLVFGQLLYADMIMHSPISNAAGGRFGGGGRGGRGHNALVSRCIKIKSGPYKGYRGRVKEVNGALVRVELDSLMKIVTGEYFFIVTTVAVRLILNINLGVNI
jgi:transcription elongation factor SPT5